MRQYPKYKDSGIQWIGKIPEEWNVLALKYIGDARNGLTYSPMDVTDAGILVLRSSNIQDSKLAFEDNVFVKEAPDFLKMKKGDILICSRNGSLALVGKSVYIPEDMDAVFGAFMLRYRPHIPNRFIFYVVQEAILKYKAFYATSTVNQLTVDVLGRMQVPFPPISEQQAIVCYLDSKTAEIDQSIYFLEQQKTDLQKYRTALISQTVTRGLNPNAKLKDSGIQWIGQIPEGWNVRRLKDISVFINGYAFNSNSFSKEKGKRVIRIGDIGSTIDYVNCIRTTEQNDALELYQIHENDILIAMSGATTGKSCLAVNVEEAYINQRVGIIRSEHYGYISYILQMPYLSEYISLNDVGSAQPNVSGKSIGNLPISLPPIAEQQAIVDYLDSKTAKIDETIRRIDEQVNDLRAYRTAIISEVVTGKIDVRNN